MSTPTNKGPVKPAHQFGYDSTNKKWAGIAVSPAGVPSVSIAPTEEIIEKAVVGSYKYFGFAAVGSSHSDAVWKIFRLDSSTTGLKRYANGVTTYTLKWDDGAGTDYSTYAYS